MLFKTTFLFIACSFSFYIMGPAINEAFNGSNDFTIDFSIAAIIFVGFFWLASLLIIIFEIYSICTFRKREAKRLKMQQLERFEQLLEKK